MTMKAEAFARLGDRNAALIAFEHAIRLCHDVPTKYPGEPHKALQRLLIERAIKLSAWGQYREALESLSEALKAIQWLVADGHVAYAPALVAVEETMSSVLSCIEKIDQQLTSGQASTKGIEVLSLKVPHA